MWIVALCEKTRCPLILNMVSVDISMVKIWLVNIFMVISSLDTGCTAKRVYFYIIYQPKLIQMQSLEVLQKLWPQLYQCLSYFWFHFHLRVEVKNNFLGGVSKGCQANVVMWYFGGCLVTGGKPSRNWAVPIVESRTVERRTDIKYREGVSKGS